VGLDVSEGRVSHYVSTLLPALDWQGGLLGIRLQFEPQGYGRNYANDFFENRSMEQSSSREESPAKRESRW